MEADQGHRVRATSAPRREEGTRSGIRGPSRSQSQAFKRSSPNQNIQQFSDLTVDGGCNYILLKPMDKVQAFEFDGAAAKRGLIDPFGRAISYLRVSVTDRCDFRCVYCMAENMSFLPKAELLTLEELDRLCSAFIAQGVRKLRLTGGEPLVRRGIMTLFASLSRHLAEGNLDELTLTTNGSQLAKYAAELAGHGIKRINV